MRHFTTAVFLNFYFVIMQSSLYCPIVMLRVATSGPVRFVLLLVEAFLTVFLDTTQSWEMY